MVFGYLILIIIDYFQFYLSVFSLILVLIKKMYQTMFQTPPSSSKVFSTLFSVFKNCVLKHGLPCLLIASCIFLSRMRGIVFPSIYCRENQRHMLYRDKCNSKDKHSGNSKNTSSHFIIRETTKKNAGLMCTSKLWAQKQPWNLTILLFCTSSRTISITLEALKTE